ncbi:MAG: SGNH/GDSL hydrolase family protein [Bacteroidota bacterium]
MGQTVKLLLVLVCFLTQACTPAVKPKILIIGDSISIGYTPFVKQQLMDKAAVFHNPGNAQHSGTGVKKIEEWIGSEVWDIIQFNWGLWDLCYRHPDSKVQGNRDKVNGTLTYSIEDYAQNLDTIVTTLKAKTKAKLIFITTTYVPENEAGRFQEDAFKYNEAAKAVMEKHDITINDIFTQSKDIHLKEGKGRDDVHFTEAGYEALGVVIANFLKPLLNSNSF